jgi:hypothetical protein
MNSSSNGFSVPNASSRQGDFRRGARRGHRARLAIFRRAASFALLRAAQETRLASPSSARQATL